MKKLISIILVILVIGGIFAACNNNKTTNSKNNESNTSNTAPEDEAFSKFDEIKTAITADFVSVEAKKIYNIITSSNTVSGSNYEIICKFLEESSSSIDDLNALTRIFKLTSNCQLEINGRTLWLVVNTGDGINRACVIENIDVFNIGNGQLNTFADFSIYNDTVYQYGRFLYKIYGKDYTLINNGIDHIVLQCSNVLTVLQSEKNENGLISSISEKVLAENIINPKNITSTKGMVIYASGAACEQNSLFYQTKNYNIIHYNLITGEKKIVSTDENCLLLSDASGVYWINTKNAEGYDVYNIPSSSPDAEMFINHPSTIINLSGEEVKFSFDTLI